MQPLHNITSHKKYEKLVGFEFNYGVSLIQHIKFIKGTSKYTPWCIYKGYSNPNRYKKAIDTNTNLIRKFWDRDKDSEWEKGVPLDSLAILDFSENYNEYMARTLAGPKIISFYNKWNSYFWADYISCLASKRVARVPEYFIGRGVLFDNEHIIMCAVVNTDEAKKGYRIGTPLILLSKDNEYGKKILSAIKRKPMLQCTFKLVPQQEIDKLWGTPPSLTPFEACKIVRNK